MRNFRINVVVFCLLTLAAVSFATGRLRASGKTKPDPDAPQPVTVAKLVELVENAKSVGDEAAEKDIGHLELTERLSSLELARLTEELSGAKSRAALMAVGDASAFLEPPGSEAGHLQPVASVAICHPDGARPRNSTNGWHARPKFPSMG